MIKKIKNKILVSTALSMLSLSTCFAAEGDTPSSMADALSAGIEKMVDNIMGGIYAIIPHCLVITSAFLGWKFGFKFFKASTK